MEVKNFPKELLIEIFGYVSVKDLLNLTLVCKSFNDVISNTSDFTRRFKVILNHRRRNLKWIGSRKYEHFKISGCNRQEFARYVRFFDEDGKSVKYLEIYENTFNVEYLWILFSYCPNLRRVILHYNSTNIFADDGFTLPYLEALYYEGESLCIGNFYKCTQLKTLVLSASQNFPDHYVEKFLTRQKNLKNLRLIDFDRDGFVFNSLRLHKRINFQLESLSLVNISYPENTARFREFLNLHRETLKFLEIGNIPYGILRHFADFRNLKMIKIISIFERDEINIDNFFIAPMEQIEHLVIDNQNVSNFAAKFPNLITLETCRIKLKTTEIKQLKYLQNLTVVDSKNISNLSTINVRKISFVSCHFHGSKILTNNRRFIEKLSIKDCKNVEWLNDFLQYEYLNLKHFEITGTNVSNKLHRDIMKMETKVEKFIASSNKLMNEFQMLKQTMGSCWEIFCSIISCLCEPNF